MSYTCECHQIGGPWIAEDPNCPIHGHNGSEAIEERVDELEERVVELNAVIATLTKLIEENVSE